MAKNTEPEHPMGKVGYCKTCGKKFENEGGKKFQEELFQHAKETGHREFSRKAVEQ